MKSFKTLITENKEMWDEIDNHHDTMPERLRHHIDNWVGVTKDQVERGSMGGIMMPDGMEENHKEIHKSAEGIRDSLRGHYGDHIMAYRGTVEGGTQSHGRKNILYSWTTNRAVAERFAGASGVEVPTHSRREIKNMHAEFMKNGKLSVHGKTYVKDPHHDGYVDIYNKHGHHVTGTDNAGVLESMHDDNQWHIERNSNLVKAKARVVSKRIPVEHVVYATNAANQKELIVRGH